MSKHSDFLRAMAFGGGGGGGVTPSGSVTITENGTYDVTTKAEAVVSVASDGDKIVDGTISGVYTSGVQTVRESAFRHCLFLTGANLPNAIAIEDYAFYTCNNFEEINIPKAESIGNGTFYGTKIQSLILPSIKTIWSRIAQQCPYLTKVDCGASLESLRQYAFDSSGSLTTFIVRTDAVPPAGANVFNGTPIASGTGYIYVKDALVDAFKAATNWSTYASQIKPLSELPS